VIDGSPLRSKRVRAKQTGTHHGCKKTRDAYGNESTTKHGAQMPTVGMHWNPYTIAAAPDTVA